MLESYENLQQIGAIIWNGGEICPIYNDINTGDILVEDTVTSMAYYIPELANQSDFMEVLNTAQFEEMLLSEKESSGAVGAIIHTDARCTYFFPTKSESTFSYGDAMILASNTLTPSKLPTLTIDMEADLDEDSME